MKSLKEIFHKTEKNIISPVITGSHSRQSPIAAVYILDISLEGSLGVDWIDKIIETVTLSWLTDLLADTDYSAVIGHLWSSIIKTLKESVVVHLKTDDMANMIRGHIEGRQFTDRSLISWTSVPLFKTGKKTWELTSQAQSTLVFIMDYQLRAKPCELHDRESLRSNGYMLCTAPTRSEVYMIEKLFQKLPKLKNNHDKSIEYLISKFHERRNTTVRSFTLSSQIAGLASAPPPYEETSDDLLPPSTSNTLCQTSFTEVGTSAPRES